MKDFLTNNGNYILSIIAIIISITTAAYSYYLTKKINSKEYKIYEDLKYQIIQVIASLKAIDTKAAASIDIKKRDHFTKIKEKYKPNYEHEINIITELQRSPGYLIFLNSIGESATRATLESIFRNLSIVIQYEEYSCDYLFIRGAVHKLIKYIKYSLNKKVINNDKTFYQIIELCNMEGVFTSFDYEKVEFIKNYLNNDAERQSTEALEQLYNKKWEELIKSGPDKYETFKRNDFIFYLKAQGIEKPNVQGKSMEEIKKMLPEEYNEYLKITGLRKGNDITQYV